LELKNANSNGDYVVASNPKNINFIILKIVIIELKNKNCMLFFLQDVEIAGKT
jgi:hypothetical protein